MKNEIAIVGTVGIPSNYGGFETVVENLVKYHFSSNLSQKITVYCSSRKYSKKRFNYLSAKLKFVPLNANGIQSILYDICCLITAVWYRSNIILLLGVSGAIALPFIRIFSSCKIVTNIDGIEWRREKWRGIAKYFLRLSEKLAVHFSHDLIADNKAIACYIEQSYGVKPYVIAYGGDHAVDVSTASVIEYNLPAQYAFSVCRIEPENNIHLILDAFSQQDKIPLVLVGNWSISDYSRGLYSNYKALPNIYLIEPIYDLGKLKTLRAEALLYVHGHSAGGTNPSLVEAMHFGIPIIAYDCDFNFETTEQAALFFKSSVQLLEILKSWREEEHNERKVVIKEIAQRRYTWATVAKEYFDVLCK